MSLPIENQPRYGTVLKSLLQRNKMLDYPKFRAAWAHTATQLARNTGSTPARTPSSMTWSQWVNTSTPPQDPQQRRVLEAMFPGKTVELLFATTDRQQPCNPNTPTQWQPAGDSKGPKTPQQLGAHLREHRQRGEVRAIDLAIECAVDRTMISKVETGTRTMPRRFWAEADAALAAGGNLLQAFDHFQHATQTPPRHVRVLARGSKAAAVQVRDDITPDELKHTRESRQQPRPERHLRPVPDLPRPANSPSDAQPERAAINDQFRSLRLTRGWTQAELAEKACQQIEQHTGHRPAIDAQAISRIECGEITWPRRATRDALVTLLGVQSDRDLGLYPKRTQHDATQARRHQEQIQQATQPPLQHPGFAHQATPKRLPHRPAFANSPAIGPSIARPAFANMSLPELDWGLDR